MMEAKNSKNTTKWMGLVASIWVQAIAGNSYSYPKYAPAIKAAMDYDQLQLNSLSVAKDIGKSVGLLAGFLADALPPSVVLLIGALVGTFGYGTLWLIVTERLSPLPFWQMCIAMILAGNSTTWMNTAILVTCMSNFSRKGLVTGVLKGYMGLSTAIFTMLVSSFFSSDTSTFLLLITVAPAVVCFIAMYFLRPVPASSLPKNDVEEQKTFQTMNLISILLAIYLLAFSIFRDLTPVGPRLYTLLGMGLVVLLVAPVVIPVKIFMSSIVAKPEQRPKSPQIDEQLRQPLLKDNALVPNLDESAAPILPVPTQDAIADPGKEEEKTKAVRPDIGTDHSFSQALTTIEFWLLFLTNFCGIGTGVAAINNFGQIGEAQGYDDVSVFISLISVCGFFGRIAAGVVSEHYARSAAVPRPVWMAVSQVLMIVGYVMLASAAPGSLYMGSMVIGVCHGVQITIVVPTSSELFGMKSFGVLYNVFILNIPLGSLIFTALSGYLYDRESGRMGDVESNAAAAVLFAGNVSKYVSAEDNVSGQCLGAHCFRVIFVILSLVGCVGLALNILLILRLRPLYRSLYGSKAAFGAAETTL